MSLGPSALIAILLLIGNAFFVGAEFALISARRTQIEPKAATGSRSAKVTLRAMSQVSLMMAGAQLGITLCSIGLGAVAKPAVADALEGPFAAVGMPEALIDPLAIAISLIIVVSLHMVLGEMVPKNVALSRPQRSALFLGPLLYGVVIVLRPVLWMLNTTANGILRLLRVKVRDEVATTFTRDEVAGLVEESAKHGFLDHHEQALLAGALDFAELPVTEVAVPIIELVSVTTSVTPRELQEWCVRTGYSRFPVLDEAGSVMGYVHVKDLVSISQDKLDLPIQPRWMRDMPQVSSTDQLKDVLATMQRRGVHMVQVREDGQRTSIAMLEDVLEKLVGEVVA
jgi:CBS domain containing-hemolysin-like protein